MRIKLGKLPCTSSTRMTISMPAFLKSQLEQYAQLHSKTWGQSVDASKLIPYILERFLATDPAFQKYAKAAEFRGPNATESSTVN